MCYIPLKKGRMTDLGLSYQTHNATMHCVQSIESKAWLHCSVGFKSHYVLIRNPPDIGWGAMSGGVTWQWNTSCGVKAWAYPGWGKSFWWWSLFEGHFPMKKHSNKGLSNQWSLSSFLASIALLPQLALGSWGSSIRVFVPWVHDTMVS